MLPLRHIRHWKSTRVAQLGDAPKNEMESKNLAREGAIAASTLSFLSQTIGLNRHRLA
jgi:hypothetical protein